MSQSQNPLHVRKYQNRKLYVIEKSSYVSMLELADLVASGKSVAVTCDLTGRDLTIETLARALYERCKLYDPEASKVRSGDLESVIRSITPRGAKS